MDVERTIEFILEQQARTETNLAMLSEGVARIDARLDRAIRLAVREARSERRKRHEMDVRWQDSMTRLADAQRATEESLRRLSDRVDSFLAGRLNGGNGHPPESPQ